VESQRISIPNKTSIRKQPVWSLCTWSAVLCEWTWWCGWAPQYLPVYIWPTACLRHPARNLQHHPVHRYRIVWRVENFMLPKPYDIFVRKEKQAVIVIWRWPHRIPSPWEDRDPHFTQCFLGPKSEESPPQPTNVEGHEVERQCHDIKTKSKQGLDLFSRFCRAQAHDIQHAAWSSIAIGCTSCIRCNLN